MEFLPPEVYLGLQTNIAPPPPIQSQPQTNNGGNQYSGKLPENYTELSKDPSFGETSLNGHKYIITPNSQTVDNELVNSPKLGIKNNQVYFFEPSNSSWNLLSSSDMEKVIIDSIFKKNSPIPEPNTIEALQLNQNSPLIKQVNQILPDTRPINVDHLTTQKFQPHISLFEDKFALLGLGLLGVGIFMLIRDKKD